MSSPALGRVMLANIACYARTGFVETDRRTEDSVDRVFMARRLA